MMDETVVETGVVQKSSIIEFEEETMTDDVEKLKSLKLTIKAAIVDYVRVNMKLNFGLYPRISQEGKKELEEIASEMLRREFDKRISLYYHTLLMMNRKLLDKGMIQTAEDIFKSFDPVTKERYEIKQLRKEFTELQADIQKLQDEIE